MKDLLYAFRTLRRTPGFTIVAVLTLTLGIGAITPVFSVAYGVLFRPLPFRDPARLAAVWDPYLPQTAILAPPGGEPAEVHITFIDGSLLPLQDGGGRCWGRGRPDARGLGGGVLPAGGAVDPLTALRCD